MRDRRDELLKKYDVIHGHFVPEKYDGLFPHTDFIAFFRDPFQQAISHYELRRIPHVDHPAVRDFHQANMTIEDFVAWEATKNPQIQLMGGFALEDFAMVGMTEEFPQSIALFNCIFGRRLLPTCSTTSTQLEVSQGYVINARLRKLIEIHRAEDIDLYMRAKELFGVKQVAEAPSW